jgi:hypothetical protein
MAFPFHLCANDAIGNYVILLEYCHLQADGNQEYRQS